MSTEESTSGLLAPSSTFFFCHERHCAALGAQPPDCLWLHILRHVVGLWFPIRVRFNRWRGTLRGREALLAWRPGLIFRLEQVEAVAVAAFALSPLKDGLQSWREGSDRRFVQAPLGGASKFDCFYIVLTVLLQRVGLSGFRAARVTLLDGLALVLLACR